MKVNEIRESFIAFFEKKGHRHVLSSPLVPFNDETLLFTNAGMVQFKEVFLGRENRPYTCAVSAQCCIRAGGKHNDLENVGYTARHHTFFEMLGNFSFGDYFKREAIHFAWEYLTKIVKIPAEKLWVTVYTDDDEAADIWLKEIKVDPARFSRCGEKDNLWAMGDTGPCGPCTEIFYDHGPSIPGGPPGSEQEGDRYIEIWNLVFMQFNRDSEGHLTPLPKPSVDTGMGLERLAAVLQGVHSNYEIDLFVDLIKATARELNLSASSQQGVESQQGLRVLVDHIRATAFLMAEGVFPSNEGRGYVLRRIIRRALRHGHQLGASMPFFYRLVAPLVAAMDAYPALKQHQAQIEKGILKEETQFARTLEQGLRILEQEIKTLRDPMISGETVFKLYDTYGFPVDLTADIAREKGLEIDIAGFEREMQIQRERARAASQFAGSHASLQIEVPTTFTGYTSLEAQTSVVAVIEEGEKSTIVLEASPFYAEGGGQVGDKGIIENEQGIFLVEDTQKKGDVILHIGTMKQGEIKAHAQVLAKVNKTLRKATQLNHSATHLLHAALREVLGKQVIQKGSLVEPTRLRFDFSYPEPVTGEVLREIEQRVNEKIRENTLVKTELLTPEEAIQKGAMALFGEKYGSEVRVLTMGEGYSVELCGGTHVSQTGEIGLFKIVGETSVAAGIRRIEALTGQGALTWLFQADESLQRLSELLKSARLLVEEKVKQLLERLKITEKENRDLKGKLARGSREEEEVIAIGEIKLLIKKVDLEPKLLRDLMDNLKNKLGKAIIVLATMQDQKVQLTVGVTKNCIDRFSANELVRFVAEQIGGKGGGRPDLAQAGGGEVHRLDAALASIEAWVEKKL